jgi:cell division protein FtsQ
MARRIPTPPPVAVPQPLPGDVRVMNAISATVFVLALLGTLMAAHAWLMRSTWFPIRQIELQGDMARNSVPTIRANATPLLAGNFFSIDLQQGRSAFEAVPWVRRAVVRRVWPDTLVVALEEHRPAALWQDASDDAGSNAGDRLVNEQGEVFQANLGDVEDLDLPRLAGPEGTAAQMLAVYGRVNASLAPLKLNIRQLALSHRGSWRAELDTGAVIELGRGSDDQVVARSERFARTFEDVKTRWPQPLDYADLRHTDGYALRLRGVTTSLNTSTSNATPGAALARLN